MFSLCLSPSRPQHYDHGLPVDPAVMETFCEAFQIPLPLCICRNAVRFISALSPAVSFSNLESIEQANSLYYRFSAPEFVDADSDFPDEQLFNLVRHAYTVPAIEQEPNHQARTGEASGSGTQGSSTSSVSLQASNWSLRKAMKFQEVGMSPDEFDESLVKFVTSGSWCAPAAGWARVLRLLRTTSVPNGCMRSPILSRRAP